MTQPTGMLVVTGLIVAGAFTPSVSSAGDRAVELGPRPFYLVDDMDAGDLKSELQQCRRGAFRRSNFSIGHRGAPLQFPELTRESYEAAARMGAGILECDVTFTKDRELVCRHSQCDLHTTTNILASPLAAKCSEPFVPAQFDPATGQRLIAASARCCTSDITLAEFRTLKGKMDAANPDATTVNEYLDATPGWRTDLYSPGTLVTHAESIRLFRDLGVQMTPELKEPLVPMPYDGDYTRAAYAQQLIDEYEGAGVPPREVWPQSFGLEDVLYWVDQEPEFGRQAVYLDDIDTGGSFPTLAELEGLHARGVNVVAPPLWALLDVNGDGEIVPSVYAEDARAAGLDIIAWSLERSGPLATGGGWYYQSVTPAIDNDGDMLKVVDVLARDVGVLGLFSDWPATVTYYANCTGL